MTSTDRKRLARSIQRELGINYTAALREAKQREEAQNSSNEMQREVNVVRTVEEPDFPRHFDEFPYNSDDLISDLFYGIHQDGNYARINFEQEANVLCLGATGSGVTNTSRNLAFAALQRSMYYEVSVISPKGAASEFSFAKPFARAVVSEIGDALALVRAVHSECIARNEVREMWGAASFLELEHQKLHDERVTAKRHLLFINDVLTLLEPRRSATDGAEGNLFVHENSQRTEIAELLAEIIRYGQVTGIHLVAEAQSASLAGRTLPSLLGKSAKIIHGRLPRLELARVGIAVEELPSNEVLEPFGRGIFQSNSGEVKAFQAWLMDAEPQLQELNITGDSFFVKQKRINLDQFRD